ncbi:DUF4126 domain-containing protein [Ideonella sp.]|uniref:DUF4126 domain-containing protein n=1 Tax=Ideonella sp. TaxID=1929293 RepID=UPI0035AFAEA1
MMDWSLPPSITQTVAGLDAMHLLALAAALGWASGLRMYAVVFLTGLAGAVGWITLPAGLQVLQHPAVLAVAGVMVLVEFFADKVPWVDSLWDAVHTFIRIPAGAALAAGAFGADAGAWSLVAALMGGGLAATAHAAKATTRAAVNASPEPFSNIGLSLLGDATVPVMLWLAWSHPVLFFVALAIALVVMAGLIVLLFKFVRGLVGRLRQHFGAAPVRA